MRKPVIFCALITGLYVIINSSCKDNINPLPIEIAGIYSVFAWNDLGMHCLNPIYNKLVILSPYNNVLIQAVRKGNLPAIGTSGIAVYNKLTTNSTFCNKGSFGGFRDNALKLFGTSPDHDSSRSKSDTSDFAMEHGDTNSEKSNRMQYLSYLGTNKYLWLATCFFLKNSNYKMSS